MSAGGRIDSELMLRLVVAGGIVPVPAEASFHPADPYAVRVTFDAGGERVEWLFARQLLIDGLTGPAGIGDVRVWPATGEDGPLICLWLSSPSGRALFEAPFADIVTFLARTYEVVPCGAESAFVDLDGELIGLGWPGPS